MKFGSRTIARLGLILAVSFLSSAGAVHAQQRLAEHLDALTAGMIEEEFLPWLPPPNVDQPSRPEASAYGSERKTDSLDRPPGDRLPLRLWSPLKDPSSPEGEFFGRSLMPAITAGSDGHEGEEVAAIDPARPFYVATHRLTPTTQFVCPDCHTSNSGDSDIFRLASHRVCAKCGHVVRASSRPLPRLAMRFGWWGTANDGSPAKVGQYQDLSPSPFWDLDGLWTNRRQTLDLTMSGLDQEANNVRGYFYGHGLTAKLDYERFLSRFENAPLAGFDLNSGVPGPTDKVVVDDLNVGQDYAIRVQKLDASAKGKLTKNLRWKINVWGMRKSGDRQANAMAHCFNINPPPATADYTCHVLSQRQKIDWMTMEVTPGLEANVGKSVIEYTRTMRAFGQSDQAVTRTYTAFDYSPVFGSEGPPYVYAWVPETYTAIDRIKLNVPMNRVNDIYSHMYFGSTQNEFRDTKRRFNGFDLRLTNRALDDVTLVAYTKLDTQRNDLPSTYLTSAPFGVSTGPAGTFEPSSLRHPINYTHTRAGLKGRWQTPSENWLSVAGGYEFSDLGRKFAVYDTLSGTFTQQDTQRHQIHIGPYLRVSRTLDTYLRYKAGFIANPLIGVTPNDGNLNTNRPEQVHRIELGGTWSPTPNFVATSMFGIENSWNHSAYAHFDENNYPILCTVWYAPTERLSLTAGYAFLSNWIDQDITVGFLTSPTETTRWNYDGYNNLITCSADYAYSPRTRLVGRFEWDRGKNAFLVPASPAGADWSALPSFSDVIVETRRINVGVDHEFGRSTSGYIRYVHFDYDDLASGFQSGTTNMFLGGLRIIR